MFAQGRAPPVPQRRAIADRRVGRRRVFRAGDRRHRHRDDAGRRRRHPRRHDDDRRLRHVPVVHGADHDAGDSAGEHRHADDRSVRGPRSHPRNPQDGDRGRGGRRPRADAGRSRRSRVRRRDVRIQPGRAGAEARLVPRAGRLDDGPGGVERIGQEHAHQPGHGVQPAAVRAACWSTAATSATCKLRDYRAHLGVVLQDNFLFDGTIAENIAYAQAARVARGNQGRQPHCPLRRVRRSLREELRHHRRRTRRAAVRRTAPAGGDRAGDSRRPADPDPGRSDVQPRQRERSADSGRPEGAATRTHDVRHRASPVDDPERRSDSRARSAGRSSSGARTTSCWQGRALPAAVRQAVPFERDRFINPGEDFTPEPAAVSGPARTSTAL